MYIAGSHTAKDWYGDGTKVPDWGNLRQSTRYQTTGKALKENSVALQLENGYPNQITFSRTYGAPVLDAWKGGNNERDRQYADPVSILDRSSHMSFKLQPPKSLSLTHD